MNKFKSFVLAFFALGLVFTSCKKDEVNDNGNDINQAQEIDAAKTAVVMDKTLSAIEEFVDIIYEDNRYDGSGHGQSNKSSVVDCRTVVFEDNSTLASGVLTISFQNLCLINGHTHQGSITVAYDTNPSMGDVELVYTLNNYYYDGINITGGGTIIKDYANENNNLERTHDFNIGVTFPSQINASREGQLVREWVVLDLNNLNNSVAEIIGGWTDSIEDIVTRVYLVNPDNPLTYSVSCAYFVSGEVAITNTSIFPNRNYTGVLDFGNVDDCDRIFTLRLSDGTVITIEDVDQEV